MFFSMFMPVSCLYSPYGSDSAVCLGESLGPGETGQPVEAMSKARNHEPLAPWV